MTAALLIRQSAQQQLLEADRWWREHRLDAPDLFLNEVSEGCALLCERPGAGAQVRRRGWRDIRRFLLRATRYHIYYHYELEYDRVLVLAIWSAVRGRFPRL